MTLLVREYKLPPTRKNITHTLGAKRRCEKTGIAVAGIRQLQEILHFNEDAKYILA